MTSTPEHGGNVTRSAGSTENPSSSSDSPMYYYDNVTVSIVPEKKGLFLKHSEYEVRHLNIIIRALCITSYLLCMFLHSRSDASNKTFVFTVDTMTF